MSVVHPPVAEKKPRELEMFGVKRVDPYFWLRERDTEPVLQYLKSENRYADSVMADTQALQEKLVAEMKARIVEDDESVPQAIGPYEYFVRIRAGQEYPVQLRRPVGDAQAEEVLVDENERGKGLGYYSLAGPDVSDDHRWMAIAEDVNGSRIHTISIRDLQTGEWLPRKIENCNGATVWAADNETLFFVRYEPQTMRSYQVWRFNRSTGEESLVMEEKDPVFDVGIVRSRSLRFVFFVAASKETTEYRVLAADQPQGTPWVFLPRQAKHEYSVEDAGDEFWILSNWKARNFRVMSAAQRPITVDEMKEILPHRADTLVERLHVFKDFWVTEERNNGLTQLRVSKREPGAKGNYLTYDEPAYLVEMMGNPNYDAPSFRFSYSSLKTPPSVLDYNIGTGAKSVLKQKLIPTYNRDNYEVERVWARAKDGVSIPISILYRKGRPQDGGGPVLLDGYGSYGISNDPYFHTAQLSLVDRGFAVAIAHVRGGSEMGRSWYEDGKKLAKKNTFTDFIAVSEFLIEQKYAARDRLFATGGSAGGLLMGAVINERPDLYRGVVAQVPFVDVVSTMLDDTLPLTTGEYEEWGNPNEEPYFRYMLSYSPYDNVKRQAYPHLLVMTGYHDSQVQYWEPAKWVAKLREFKTDHNLLLLKTEFDVGHGGLSGRYQGLGQIAYRYAFLLKLTEH